MWGQWDKLYWDGPSLGALGTLGDQGPGEGEDVPVRSPPLSPFPVPPSLSQYSSGVPTHLSERIPKRLEPRRIPAM